MKYGKKNFFCSLFCLIVLFIFFPFGSAYANGAKVCKEIPSYRPNQWNFLVALYGWVPWITGDVTVKGNKSDVNATPSDLLDALDFVFSLHMEANKGNITYMLDPTYFRLSDDVKSNIGSAKIKMEQTLADFGVYYKFMSKPMGGANNWLTAETFVGGRYWNMEVENKIKIAPPILLAPTRTKTLSDRKNWLDPVIGARLVYHINNKWLFSLHGDIGGFDLISKFTWELKLIGMYKINRHVGIAAGFRALDVDYKDGKGANEFRFNNIMYGPELGIAVTF